MRDLRSARIRIVNFIRKKVIAYEYNEIATSSEVADGWS